ncbi:MAG: hypothetical protein V1921_02465 [Candidatus Altiarchaeota archaeon]
MKGRAMAGADARGSIGDIPDTFEPLEKEEPRNTHQADRLLALLFLGALAVAVPRLQYYYQFWYIPLLSVLGTLPQIVLLFLTFAFILTVGKSLLNWWLDLIR